MHTVAVIGCGRISEIAHFPALSKMEDVRIKYACDIIPGKAQQKKENFPKIENTIEDYKTALADPEVDTVFVLTPNYAHYTVTMDALAAGKNVFCEKPITVNYELSAKMKEAADKAGKILNIGVCNRYNLSVEKLAQMNKEGKFGNIYHVYGSVPLVRVQYPDSAALLRQNQCRAGGAPIDWGVHFLDLILYILGGAKLVTATCDSYNKMAADMKSYRYHSMWAEDTADTEHGTNDVDDFITGYVRTDKSKHFL